MSSANQPLAASTKNNNLSGGLKPPSLLVFSGGTAFHDVIAELRNLTTQVTHVIPVSNDEGSAAEISRVFGGPAVGDLRSRCLALSDGSNAETLAVRALLGHRLPNDPRRAKSEWYKIVEGEHTLWIGLSEAHRQIIRGFLVHFQNQIHLRSDESEAFCFSDGSIGDFFLVGARIFSLSLDAATFLFSEVLGIPAGSKVLPVISTNDRLTLGCQLMKSKEREIIRGHKKISHPSNNLPHSSRIKRVFYVSSESDDEVFPSVNPAVLKHLDEVDCIVYEMGSLFTSICSSLVLNGVGEKIASRTCPKVLILRGSNDLETSRFAASSYVTVITEALNRVHGNGRNRLRNKPKHYITTLFVPKGYKFVVDNRVLEEQEVFDVVVDSVPIYDPKSLVTELGRVARPSSYRP